MKKQISFSLGVGIIVAAAIAVGIVWYYKTGQPVQPPGNIIVSTSTPAGSVTYTNNDYGFTFSLPTDWQGYSIVTSTWNGNSNEGCPANGCPTVTGPEILIRNPQWTQTNPWQDIPIMIFTHSEWSAVTSGTLTVSAAPFPPSELGENTTYVFALPPRYDYAYPNGWQEVETIIQGNPLHAFDASSSSLGYFQGKQICQTDSDCPAGDVCTIAGPIPANEPPPKTCWPQGSAVPL